VVSQLGTEVRLIQCKHTQWTNVIDKEVLYELMASCDSFRANIQVAGYTFKPVLITNSSVPRLTKEFGFGRDIEVVAIDSFRSYIGGIRCTRAEVEGIERQRYATLPRLKADLIGHLKKR